MSLEELRKEGLRWVDANKSKRFSGVTKLLTDLYPDNAHFIYELLQNAEDARDKSVSNSSGASVVRFTLNEDALEFEHNGEGLFTLEDVGRITGIGDSAKRDDPTSIGKFGIGFKAVFAYTNTPEIHSGEFHFRIHDLVVPETSGVKQPRLGERGTSFSFPFDHPKKPAKQAVAEIEQGLRALGDNTLLFLIHIRKIEYLLPDSSIGSLERIDHTDERIEIRARHPGGNDTVSHWLRFQKDVEVVDEDSKPKTCRIAIAYNLVADERKKKQSDWKIAPLEHGQVSIFFPAEKETSNLRFHLHAPFASTVARDSVRDCEANHRLRDSLADLVVESLTVIRDQGMLDVNFLAVLPNPSDNLPAFYEPIRKGLITAFQKQDLTPTRMEGHAPASMLHRTPRGGAEIANVINDDDLALLMGGDHTPPMWVANAPQENQPEDRFLKSLQINEWGWNQLVKSIKKPHPYAWQENHKRENAEHTRKIETWIARKADAWLMSFYALLGEARDTHDTHNKFADVSNLRIRIVRIEAERGDEHVTSDNVFFPPDDETTAPPDIRFVKPAVYSSGRSEAQVKFATSFLKNIGVHHFNAKTVIEQRLARYKSPSKQEQARHDDQDLEQFVAYWKKNPNEANLFSDHAFLLGVSQDGNLGWHKPSQLCLDVPYLETGLASLIHIHKKFALWEGYQAQGESQLRGFTVFLKAIGVNYELKVESVTTLSNHDKKLRKDYCHGTKLTYTVIDEDYSISNIDKYIGAKTAAASRLVWDALIHADAKAARARFRPNQQYQTREAESQLVYHLKCHAWIPDKSGNFGKPEDMTKDDLRTDFPYDDRNHLLTAVGFGENHQKRSEEYRAKNQDAVKLGFPSVDVAEEWAKLCKSGVSLDDVRALASRRQPQQPEESVPFPERRKKGVIERRENAPTKESVIRERTIQPGIGQETQEAKAYLRVKYRNSDGQLVCQCCHEEMPFKLQSGEHYFETIQCIRGLDKHYFENRLALCPVCAAKYQHARETDDAEMRQRIVGSGTSDSAPSVEVPVQLAGKEYRLRFVGTHWFDLKTVLSSLGGI